MMAPDEISLLKQTRTVLSIREVAKVLNVSDTTIRRYCRLGVCFPEIDDQRRRFFSWADIEKLERYRDATTELEKEQLLKSI